MLDTTEEIGEGFRRTDTELATHYLKLILQGYYCLVAKIPVVDIYQYEPWDLPYLSGLGLSRSEWYFFCPRHDENGSRRSRQTNKGFWKSTGQDRVIKDEARRPTLFKKKSLVYHGGRSPSGKPTNWVIHEIRKTLDDGKTTQGAYVLCKLIKKPDENVKVLTDNDANQVAEWLPNTTIFRPSLVKNIAASSSYRPADNMEDESIHPTDLENSHGENNASYTTSPEEVMVGQQSDVSFIGYNEQCYGINPIPESSVTPEVDQLLVFDCGRSDNVDDEQIHATAFKNSYLSSHGENNASYTTSPEEVMAGQQSVDSFTGYNKQCYGVNPRPESSATPEVDQSDYDFWNELSVHDMVYGTSGFSAEQGWMK